jgi:Tfp pilus tip-associated adhesin PilY1
VHGVVRLGPPVLGRDDQDRDDDAVQRRRPGRARCRRDDLDGADTGRRRLLSGAAALPAQPRWTSPAARRGRARTITGTAGGSQNSLADVSQYYYKTDLRPAMANNVPSAGPNPEDDNAPHQHMTTFAIALGVSGTLQYRPDYRSLSTVTGDFADIRTGAKNWPMWPDPLLDYTNTDNYNDPKSIDDYWHTAVNGRGRFFNASNPTSVVQGLGDALAKIDNVLASGARRSARRRCSR